MNREVASICLSVSFNQSILDIPQFGGKAIFKIECCFFGKSKETNETFVYIWIMCSVCVVHAIFSAKIEQSLNTQQQQQQQKNRLRINWWSHMCVGGQQTQMEQHHRI